MYAVLPAQIYDEIQLSIGVEVTGPFDVEMWIISESVSRVQHLCSSAVGQDDLGVGERWGLRLKVQSVPSLSERNIQWPVVVQIVVADALRCGSCPHADPECT